MAAAAAAPPAEGAQPAKFGTPISFGPPAGEGPSEAAVLWLHGFGDQPEGWAQLLRPLRRATSQRWRWLHLRAPPLPQPCYKGKPLPSWGLFHTTACIHVGNRDYEDEDEAGCYAASVLAVHAEIARLEREEGVSPAKVLVCGFSQGAAVAVESVLTYEHKLAGCVALSGWLTRRARAALKQKRHAGLPFLLCHGTRDDMVGVDCAKAALKVFEEAADDATAKSVTLELFKGMEHSSCPRELKLVGSFVHKALSFAGAEPPPELKVPEWEPGGTALGSDDEAVAGEDEDESESADGDVGEGDTIFVAGRTLDALRAQLKAGGDVDVALIRELLEFDGLAEGEVLAPVDCEVLVAAEVDADDIDASLRKHGAKVVAEAFLRAADEAALAGDGEDLTVGGLRDLADGSSADEDEDELGEEEMLEEDEEEAQAADEDEEGTDGREAAGERPAKRQRAE